MRLQISVEVRECRFTADAREADRACERDDKGRLVVREIT